MNDAEKELREFISALENLADENRAGDDAKNHWEELADAVIAALPEDVEYY